MFTPQEYMPKKIAPRKTVVAPVEIKVKAPEVTPAPVASAPDVSVPDASVDKARKVAAEKPSGSDALASCIATVQALVSTLRGLPSALREAQRAFEREKREAGKAARGRRRQDNAANPRQKAGFNMATLLKDDLCDYLREVCGHANVARGTYLSRVEVTHMLHDHFENAGMHDPQDRRHILYEKDPRFASLLSAKPETLNYFNLQAHIKHQFYRKQELEALNAQQA